MPRLVRPMAAVPVLLVLALALGACTGELGEPASGGPSAATVARVELSAPVTALAAGQEAVVAATALDASGAAVQGVTLSWASSDEAVATVAQDGTVRAVAAGEVQVTAEAQGVRSAPLDLRVVAAAQRGPLTVRASAERLALKVGGVTALSARVREASGEMSATHAHWVVEPQGIVSVSEAGEVTALAVGSAQVRAEVGEVRSPPVEVLVTDGRTWPAVDVVEPSGPVAVRQALSLEVRVQELAVEDSTGTGLPLTADALQVLVDGAPFASLTPEYGGARQTLDVGALAAGPHELRVRATLGTRTVTSPPRTVRVLEPAASTSPWEELGASVTSSDEAHVVLGAQATPYIVYRQRHYNTSNPAGTRDEGYIRVKRWNESLKRWDDVAYKTRRWRRTTDGSGNTVYVEQVDTEHRLNLLYWSPQYYYYPSTAAMAPAATVDAQGRLVVAWVQREVYRDFNVPEEPQPWWYEVYVARWSPTGGADGAGGWELLSSEGRQYLTHATNPALLPDKPAPFPPPAEVRRTDDCDTPRVAVEPATGALVLAYVSTPVPQTAWGVDVRVWDEAAGTWRTRGERLALDADVLALRDFFVDGQGRALAVVEGAASGPALWRQGTDGRWQRVGEEGTPILAARELGTGGLFGAGLADGDVRGHASNGSRWVRLGTVLDREPWADAWQVSVAAASREAPLVALWSEGPQRGNRNLFAATWRPADARWEPLGSEPLESSVDRPALHPEAALDSSGRLVIVWIEDTGQDASRYVVRARRSRDPVQ